MHIRDLTKLYETKSDDELLLLASRPEQLTSEAMTALNGELAKRRIGHVDLSTESDAGVAGTERQRVRTVVSRRERVGVSKFVGEALKVYHSNFWLFIKLVAPAVLIG